eukprot:g57115.t1
MIVALVLTKGHKIKVSLTQDFCLEKPMSTKSATQGFCLEETDEVAFALKISKALGGQGSPAVFVSVSVVAQHVEPVMFKFQPTVQFSRSKFAYLVIESI